MNRAAIDGPVCWNLSRGAHSLSPAIYPQPFQFRVSGTILNFTRTFSDFIVTLSRFLGEMVVRRTLFALGAVACTGLLTGNMSASREAIAANLDKSQVARLVVPQVEVAPVLGQAVATAAVWRTYAWQPWSRQDARERRRYRQDYGAPRRSRSLPWSYRGKEQPRGRSGPYPEAYKWNYGWRGYGQDFQRRDRNDNWRSGRRWVGASPFERQLR